MPSVTSRAKGLRSEIFTCMSMQSISENTNNPRASERNRTVVMQRHLERG